MTATANTHMSCSSSPLPFVAASPSVYLTIGFGTRCSYQQLISAVLDDALHDMPSCDDRAVRMDLEALSPSRSAGD